MNDEGKRSQLFAVPEPPVGMGTGFLSDYWSSREPLPTIRGIEIWWYYIQRGVQTVLALPMSSIITVMTIAVSLFLLAGFLLILQNVGQLLNEAGNALSMTAYIKAEASEKEVTNFIRELETNSKVRSVSYTSKAQALETFRKDLGTHSSLLDGLEQNNPLPASVDVTLRPEIMANISPEEIASQLRRVAVVEDVVFGSEWADKMAGVVRIFRAFGLLTLLIAMAIIVFLISNTIKLVIYARREEITIMKLVGASDGFVKIPFIIGGLIQGLIGSAIGLSLVKLGALALNYQLQGSQVLGVTIPSIAFLHWWAAAGLVILGLAVGAIGSFFALGKFINV